MKTQGASDAMQMAHYKLTIIIIIIIIISQRNVKCLNPNVESKQITTLKFLWSLL